MALQLTVDGWSQKQIRDKLGVSQTTLWRWKQSAAWQQALWSAVKSDQQDGEVHVRTLVPLASQTLKELVVKSSDNVRLGAARLIFETVHAMAQREEQQQVLAELEEQLNELKAVATNQALPAGDLIEAEITPIAHADAHNEKQPEPEASADGGSADA